MQASPISTSIPLPFSKSLNEIKAEQAINLDILRVKLVGISMKDIVPMLVSRRVLKSYEMNEVYSKENSKEQIETLINILQTKNHWMGPFIDSLIRNGQFALVRELIDESNVNRSTSESPK
ncbi:CARD domain and Death-like domain-containing protein [Strongyloides ratti]|uniref:CARD domain and Death-like domain-containing protein n=1 Tax=Strongyloides ratti TaxID=34506 RepID=A0A090KYG2_STRRB|nr:CARD domain and Death-like domain-containing protein [Strongyloides ratti]CEF62481.1 CARD domain and Death-like domain-containing protein [Strongyloides ratti]